MDYSLSFIRHYKLINYNSRTNPTKEAKTESDPFKLAAEELEILKQHRQSELQTNKSKMNRQQSKTKQRKLTQTRSTLS